MTPPWGKAPKDDTRSVRKTPQFIAKSNPHKLTTTLAIRITETPNPKQMLNLSPTIKDARRRHRSHRSISIYRELQ